MQKEMIPSAHLIFLPYTYLLDYKCRKSIDQYLKDSIIIFDEGHNFEHHAEEGFSLHISVKDLQMVVSQCQQLLDYFQTSDESALIQAISDINRTAIYLL